MGTLSSPFVASGRDVLLIDAVRTPIGRAHRERGIFREIHPNALLAGCLKALVERSGVDPSDVDDVIVGCTAPFGEQSRNIARNAWLQAGYPVEVPAITIDRRCGSAQSAVAYAAALVGSGTHELVIAGGVEHMQHVPIDSPLKVNELFGSPWPQELLDRFEFVPQGLSAEMIAEQWDVSRAEMDGLAVESHRRAAVAADAGHFDREIIAIDTPDGMATRDQGVRRDANLASVATLKPPFKPNGRLTAATSSQLSDGAAAVLVSSAAAVERIGLTPRARLIDQVTVGVDPIIMLTGPIPATRKLLDRTGTSIGDFDLFEVNEAFASVVLAWQRDLGADMDRVNVNGGAMALGHPVGSTGARLFATLLSELERRDVELGLVTMCCGGGLGTGAVVQRL